MAAPKRGTARAVALPARRKGPALGALLPSVRSIVIGAVIVLLAIGAYVGAVESSVFAVRTIAITGGSPRVQAEVRRALAPELGRSLLRIDGGAIDRSAAAIPDVVSVHFDRAFPHTLRIRIKAERAVLLLRRVKDSWVVSSRGRVMREVGNPRLSSLPRLWVPKGTDVAVGQTLTRYDGMLAAAAVAPIAHGVFHGGVRTVVSTPTELTLVLSSGPEIRLGDIGDLRLKLAIARRLLRVAGSAAGTGSYIDVSVPERPVLGVLGSAATYSQVASTG